MWRSVAPRRYPQCGAVVLFAWPYDSENYAGGSIATGRVYHVGQVKGNDPDRKGYTGPHGWGVGRGVE
jgi:hypothetical protein